MLKIIDLGLSGTKVHLFNKQVLRARHGLGPGGPWQTRQSSREFQVETSARRKMKLGEMMKVMVMGHDQRRYLRDDGVGADT